MIPKTTVALFVGSILWVIASLILIKEPHLLVIYLVAGLGGMYFSYDQWFKKKNDNRYDEHERMLDSFLKWKLEQEDDKKEKKRVYIVRNPNQ